jgi:hypothetical protein
MKENVTKNEKEDGQFVAVIPRDDIKSLFRFLVGTSDSEEIILSRLVIIKKDDVKRLYEKLLEKLENHNVNSMVVTIDITFGNGKVKHFGTWIDYESYDWVISEETSELFLKFDFLVDLPNYEIPQRHTVTVRIVSQPDTVSILRTVFTKDPDEIDKSLRLGGPILCRVDFVNNVLGKELLDIVKDWNECCQLAIYENKIVAYLRKRPSILKYFFKYLTSFTVSMLSFFIFLKLSANYNETAALTISYFKMIIIWGFLTVIGIVFLNEISNKISSYTMNAFKKYSMRFIVFDLSNGDKEKQNRIIEKDRKNIKKFLLGLGINLLINIVAGIIVWYLFSQSNGV